MMTCYIRNNLLFVKGIREQTHNFSYPAPLSLCTGNSVTAPRLSWYVQTALKWNVTVQELTNSM
jgi:hypothetical protein